MMKLPKIYLDLDGVMADFDAHFPVVFGVSHKTLTDEDMWGRINSHVSYFYDMPPCPGALEFFKDIQSLNPIILTACPKTNYASAAQQKRQWVYQHLDPNIMVLPILGGHTKPMFMHSPGDVLIDDWRKNIEEWETVGGYGILHRNFTDTKEALRQYIFKHAMK